MRLFADEYKEGTIEVLQTSPISNTKLVLSKYFSGLTLVFLAIIPTVVYYFSLSKLSETRKYRYCWNYWFIHWTILLSSVFVAIGVYASSTPKTKSHHSYLLFLSVHSSI